MIKTRKGQSTVVDAAIFLRRPAVQRLIGLPVSTLYELMGRNQFPKPCRIGPKAVGWVAEEVQKWAADRIAERDATPAAPPKVPRPFGAPRLGRPPKKRPPIDQGPAPITATIVYLDEGTAAIGAEHSLTAAE
jgi:prophage regulatory protein